LIMEYVAGETLATQLAKGPLDIELVLRYGGQIGGALSAAHSQQIIHRDLKPANIMITPMGVKVLDFGLAKAMWRCNADSETQTEYTSLTEPGAVIGTVAYMSPEQARGDVVDTRTDLFSFGALLYEMATGQRAFPKQFDWTPPPQRGLHHSLYRLILRLVEPDPELRYQTAGEVVSALQRVQRIVAPGGVLRWLSILSTVFAEIAAIAREHKTIAAAVLFILMAAFILLFQRPFRPSATQPVSLNHHFIVEKFEVTQSSKIARIASKAYANLPPMLRVSPPRNKTVLSISGCLVGQSQPPSRQLVASDLSKALSKYLAARLAQVRLEGTSDIGVQGSTRLRDDKIEVRAKLLDKSTGRGIADGDFVGTAEVLAIGDRIYDWSLRLLESRIVPPPRIKPPCTNNERAQRLYDQAQDILRAAASSNYLDNAIDLYRKAIAIDNSFSCADAALAYAYLIKARKSGDTNLLRWAYNAAGNACSKAEAKNEERADPHLALGAVEGAMDQPLEAIAELKRGIELSSNTDAEAEGYKRLGKVYKDHNYIVQSVAAYQKAIELKPYNWVIYVYLGNAYFGLGKYEDAAQTFKKVQLLDSDRPEGFEGEGRAYFSEGHYQECIHPYERALEFGDDAATLANLGVAVFYLGDYERALILFRKAYELEKKAVNAQNVADALNMFGRYAEAQQFYERARALAVAELSENPENSVAMGNLAFVEAKLHYDSEAKKTIDAARSLDPGSFELMYKKAVIQALDGHYDEALTSLKCAIENGYSAREATLDPDLKELRKLPGFRQISGDAVQHQPAR
ncbi:MAG: protein kinase, partial [Acidobacteriaceae bacterium]|nr:protein kinase [Acidobacteriaceae bacterium]